MQLKKDINELKKTSRGYIVRPKKDNKLDNIKKKLEDTPYKVPKFRDNIEPSIDKDKKLKDSGFSKPKRKKNFNINE